MAQTSFMQAKKTCQLKAVPQTGYRLHDVSWAQLKGCQALFLPGVSQPVSAWKEGRADTRTFPSLLAIALTSICLWCSPSRLQTQLCTPGEVCLPESRLRQAHQCQGIWWPKGETTASSKCQHNPYTRVENHALVLTESSLRYKNYRPLCSQKERNHRFMELSKTVESGACRRRHRHFLATLFVEKHTPWTSHTHTNLVKNDTNEQGALMFGFLYSLVGFLPLPLMAAQIARKKAFVHHVSEIVRTTTIGLEVSLPS